MRLLHLFALLSAIFTCTYANIAGFALESKGPDGNCRTQAEWENVFKVIALFPQKFTVVRLFTSSECGALRNAVPAAVKLKVTIVVGVWAEGDDFFNEEKAALLQAIANHGHAWIEAIIVGSEDLGRGDTNAAALTTKIYDVRGMVREKGVRVSVGHADTPEAWTRASTAPVIQAVDFVGVNNYPYWKGLNVEDGDAIDDFFAETERVRRVAQGKDVWTTETGQPITGDGVLKNIPGLQAQQIYWWQVVCPSMRQMNTIVYHLDDFHLVPQFSVVDRNYRPNIDMSCPQMIQVPLTMQVPARAPFIGGQGRNSSANSTRMNISPRFAAITMSIQGSQPTVMPIEYVAATQAPHSVRRKAKSHKP